MKMLPLLLVQQTHIAREACSASIAAALGVAAAVATGSVAAGSVAAAAVGAASSVAASAVAAARKMHVLHGILTRPSRHKASKHVTRAQCSFIDT